MPIRTITTGPVPSLSQHPSFTSSENECASDMLGVLLPIEAKEACLEGEAVCGAFDRPFLTDQQLSGLIHCAYGVPYAGEDDDLNRGEPEVHGGRIA